MSSNDSTPSNASNKPKVDKFAALAAAQQQQQQTPSAAEGELQEVITNDVVMLFEDDSANSNVIEDNLPSSGQHQSAESIAVVTQQQQQPPRRDKFASMTAVGTATDPGGLNSGTDRTMVVRGGSGGGDKFAAVLAQKEIDEQNLERQRYVVICNQRDSIWNDCDAAEVAITDLLLYAEQTTDILSKNSNLSVDSEGYVKSKEQLSKLVGDYQSTVIQIHDLLSKHSHHVKAYKSNLQRKGEKISDGINASTTSNRNNIYVQRVEHRLAEAKRRLLQEMVSSIQEEK